MTRMIALAACLLVACGEGAKDDGGDTGPDGTGGAGGTGTGGGTPCSPSAADDLADPQAGLDAQAEVCAASPYWEAANMATTFFVADLQIDDCGAVTGTEKWILYMGPRMQELGYTDCEVVWDVTGSLSGPLEEGTTVMELNAVVNAAKSDCKANDDGVEIYVGEEDVMLAYTVDLTAEGADFVFTASGGYLGTGAWNANNVTYTSEYSCKAF